MNTVAGRWKRWESCQRNGKTDQLRLLVTFHYVLAAIAGLFSMFPLIHVGFGTILGIFTIIALVQEPTKALFVTES